MNAETYTFTCRVTPADELRIGRRLYSIDELWLAVYSMNTDGPAIVESVILNREDAKELRKVLTKFLKETEQS